MDTYEEQRKKEWEDLEVNRDELRTLMECMKKEEFRKILREYADEVNDPENRKQYEAEIIELERQQGVDVTFVNPEPAYVIKTSLDGRIKCFLNVCKSPKVDKPSNQAERSMEDGSPGLKWSIPYMLAPPRDDLDKKKTRCRVFDVTFHPDTLYLAQRDTRFRQMVNDTAMDGVESSYKVKLDRKNIKFPKMTYKGVGRPLVIRKPCEKPVEKLDIEPEIYQKIMSSYDTAKEQRSKVMEEKITKPAPVTKYYNSRDNKTEDKNSNYTTPRFVVKYQKNLDMNEFMESKDAKMHSAIPNNLVIIINLPLLKSATDATLDVQEQSLSLKSEKPAKYYLELPLSYRVDPDNGNARFDAKLKMLTVTLPVVCDRFFNGDAKEDSGVESDHGSPVPESEVINDQAMNNILNNSQKLENGWVLSDYDSVQSDCVNTALQTSENLIISIPFMNPNLMYSLPAFTCNLYDNILAITIHAKNVDSDSINHRILTDNAGLHILITSIGNGFFPAYYSLCLKIGKESIIPDTFNVECWDNNVVVSVKINNAENLSQYLAGVNEDFMEIKDLSVSASIKNKLQALEEDAELETHQNVEVIRNNAEVIVNIHSQTVDSDDEEDEKKDSPPEEERKRNYTQSRSVSESSGDEHSSSVGSSIGSGRYKSILKSHHKHFSRSVSESSIDDNTAPLSLTAFNDSLNELNSESEGSSLKKTVRFNDVVSRQLYRSNSSILGQRKKNQRKLKNKKRALERRLSESENSETDERDKYKIEVKNPPERDSSDAVRPILHQNSKHSGIQKKTANIQIQRSPRKAGSNTPLNKNEEKHETETNSDGDEVWKSSECKNDLLFDLDI